MSVMNWRYWLVFLATGFVVAVLNVIVWHWTEPLSWARAFLASVAFVLAWSVGYAVGCRR